MTHAEFLISGGEPYEFDIEFYSGIKRGQKISLISDIPMLAMIYQSKKRQAFEKIISKKSKNWRLIVDNNIIYQTDIQNEAYIALEKIADHYGNGHYKFINPRVPKSD